MWHKDVEVVWQKKGIPNIVFLHGKAKAQK